LSGAQTELENERDPNTFFFICFENYHNKMRQFVFLKVLSERNRLSSPLFRAIRQSPKLAGILILKKAISGKLLKLISQISDLLVMRVMGYSNIEIIYGKYRFLKYFDIIDLAFLSSLSF